jgi:type IV pilus assembly protein PilC
MASHATRRDKERLFEWEGKDRNGRPMRGQMRALGENQLLAALRRQGIAPTQVRLCRRAPGKPIKPRDIAILTRQWATMLRAGVPLLQVFDIIGRGHPNPRITHMLSHIRADVENGTSLSGSLRRHPLQFSHLYCNLVESGETAGMLDDILERLAHHTEKTEAIKSKIRSALMYPLAVVIVALVVLALIMVFVIPAFADMFSAYGADLPAPTLLVVNVSDFLIAYGWLILVGWVAALYGLILAWRRHSRVQSMGERILLRLPVFGSLVRTAVVARWCRTLSTMFAAGVPLVESLNAVGGASGNAVYAVATRAIQQEVSRGNSLTNAMTDVKLFPSMVLQMCAIGEESGSLDHMLGRAADFMETEVDDRVSGLSSLVEPVIIVLLGTVIGGIVVSMYLPIFQLGQVI